MKENNQIAAPPDGGYGWVVVLGSFMAVFMTYGSVLSYGLLLDHVMDFYQVTPGTAALPNSLLVSISLCCGPLSGACVTKFGSRITAMVGALLTSLGFAVSAFMTKFAYFCFFYAVVAGIGLSFLYLSANVHVGLYFEKRRALATGIFTMGGGVGLMVVGPLTTYLLQKYGWQGTILLIGGMFLHGAICATLFRPLEYKRLYRSIVEKPEVTVPSIPKESCELAPRSTIPLRRLVFLRSFSNDPASSKTTDTSFESLVQAMRTISASQDPVGHSSESTDDVATIKELSINPMQRLDAYYSGSIQQLAEYHNVGENLDLYRASTIRVPDDDERSESPASYKLTRLQRMKSALHNSFDLQLLKSPKMLILIAANVFGYSGAYVPFNFTPSLLVKNGASTSQVNAIYIGSGITNIIGPPIFGWLANNTKASALLISATSLLVSGAITVCAPFFDNYYLILTYFVLYGLFTSAYFCLGTIVVVECFGLEKLTSGFGLVLLARGLGASLGSPIGGALYYSTGSFIITFAYSSIMLILSCCTFLLIPGLNMLRCGTT